MIAIFCFLCSVSSCFFLSIWPRKYNSRAITGLWTVDKGKYTLPIILFVLLFCSFRIPDMGTSAVCDGRILSCDARIMRETKERAHAVQFHSISLAALAGVWGEPEQVEEVFEPDNDQGFLPTRLSVIKRRGLGQVR